VIASRPQPVTTPKLRRSAAGFADHRGWTALFDLTRPDPGMRGRPERLTGARRLSPTFDALACWTEQLASVDPQPPMVLLDPDTYHVTLCDGLSESDLDRLAPSLRSATERFLQGVPSSLAAGAAPPGAGAAWEAMVGRAGPRVRFVVTGVEVRGHAVVAALEPATADDDRALEPWARARTAALEELSSSTGLDLVSQWQPHVSVAYVPNRDAGREVAERIGDDGGPPRTSPLGVEVEAASTFAFTSMVEFWRVPRAPIERES
jgi:hypothetical protein